MTEGEFNLLCYRVRKIKKRAKKKSGGRGVKERMLGWEMIITHADQGFGPAWLLSAVLFPHHRGSTSQDWNDLGVILKAFDGPKDPLTPFDQTHPNDSHYWIWGDDRETSEDELSVYRTGIRQAKLIMDQTGNRPDFSGLGGAT